MTDDLLINSIIFFGFIILSGLFSSAETAFTAINRIKLHSLLKEKQAKHLEFLLRDTKKLLTCILIGNNLANIAATTFATAFFIDLFKTLGIQNFATVMTLITAIVTFILLIFGEISPKTMAMKNPSKWALRISPLIYAFYLISYPFVIIFSNITIQFSKLMGIQLTSTADQLNEEEIKLLIKLSQEDGMLEKEEQKMLHGVINVFNKVVREIMTPRTDMICIELTQSVSEVIELITAEGHSRIPVYEDKIDNIVGFIYAKDLLTASPSLKTINLKSFMRKAVFIPETKSIESLLQQMREAKFHLAIVGDEHGGVAGLVTMEDIIEEIVGEIHDEYDKEEHLIKHLSEQSYLIDAGASTEEVGQHIEFEFPESDDYDTIAGFLLSKLGSFPKKGQVITFEHLDFKIKEIRNRRIISIELTINEIVEPEE